MKKRILFIDGPLGGGGAERVLIDILRNFDYDRYEVDLAVICRGGALMDEVPQEVNVIELWNGYTWDYKLAFRLSKYFRCNWLFSRKMNGKKLRRDYDAEISFLEGMPLKLGALRTTSAKKISWVHADLDTHRYETAQFYKGEEEADYNKMNIIVCVSENCKKAFKNRFPKVRSELKVIYNPIDIKKIQELGRIPLNAGQEKNGNRNFKEIITVGRLNEAKNPKLLLKVARLAKDNSLPVRFKWVGDGDMRKEIESLSESMGLNDIVEFTGFTKNPYQHIRQADIMLITSKYESFCLVACEAMILGTPVISTDTAGTSEILRNNKYGQLTEHNAESILNILKEWIENPQLRNFYSQKALQRPDDYSIEKTMMSIYSLISE